LSQQAIKFQKIIVNNFILCFLFSQFRATGFLFYAFPRFLMLQTLKEEKEMKEKNGEALYTHFHLLGFAEVYK